MNRLIQLKTTSPLLTTLALLCFGLLPRAQAVVPPPDGGYPNFTTAEGTNALQSLTTGQGNTAVGWFTLESLTAGNFNTAIGAAALVLNTGDQNTATGTAALFLNTIGIQNTANGAFALLHNTDGFNNTAIGFNALFSNTDGFNNTAIGEGALQVNATGSNNIALGSLAASNVTTASDVICIGTSGADVSNSCYIANIFAQQVDPTSSPVIVDNQGKLGIVVSSRRFKHDIKPMAKSSEVILALKPVRFHYKSDTKDIPQFGLIAEEVAKVNPALVLPDKEGKPYTVRYEAVNAMLLNEFLKEHRTNEEQGRDIQEQKATIALQQKQIEALTAGLQKVSAQFEASKSAPQLAENNQ